MSVLAQSGNWGVAAPVKKIPLEPLSRKLLKVVPIKLVVNSPELELAEKAVTPLGVLLD